MEQLLIVKCISAKNCFLHLPINLHKQYYVQNTCVKLMYGQDTIFLTCNPQPLSDPENPRQAGLSSAFAKTLGINDGDYVICSLISYSGSLLSVHAMPFTEEDWDILETNAERIQTTLMNQIRIVSDKQIITVWCSNTLYLTFQIVSMQPKLPVGYLENNTEIHIIHPTEKQTYQTYYDLKQSTWGISNLFSNLNKSINKKHDTLIDGNTKLMNDLNVIFKKYNQKPTDVYRIVSMKNLYITEVMKNSLYVYIDQKYIPENHKCSNVYRIRKVYCPKSKDENKNNKTGVVETYVKLGTMDRLPEFFSQNDKMKLAEYFENVQYGSLVIPADLCYVLKLNLGHRVILEHVKETLGLKSIELCSNSVNINDVDLINEFKEFIINNSNGYRVLITNNTILHLPDLELKVMLVPEDLNYVELSLDCFRTILINVKPVDLTQNNISLIKYEIDDQQNVVLDKICEEISTVKNIIQRCVEDIEKGFGNLGMGQNILIEGSEGSGKSTIVTLIMSQLSSKNYYHTQTIACRLLKGKRLETVQKDITAVMYEACVRAPSVIVLDDFECLSCVGRDEQNIQDVQNCDRISNMVYNLLVQCQARHKVSVVATTRSLTLIGPRLYSARGRHVFCSVYKISELGKDERINLLQYLLRLDSYFEPNIDWNRYSTLTVGYVIQDLVDVSEKAVFKSWKMKSSQPSNPTNLVRPTITSVILSEAIRESKPLRLSDYEDSVDNNSEISHDSNYVLWNSIGGLDNVKQSLEELVRWPTMYPSLFSAAPITASRGALLAGPPGCGKTLLVRALAQHYNLRLVSVRGPELLSKYMGRSEQAVREAFRRAESARPCILFFDEFDSLAPRRGHDTSGVADRVVNQLLTELDGAECRRDSTPEGGGVCVLAATSRPDLVDPALLRPGRLDPMLLCDPPDTAMRRMDILQKVTRKYSFRLSCEAEVFILELAERTCGFSGADLDSLVRQAAEYSSEQMQAQPIISKQNLRHAFENTGPSLSVKVLRRYELVTGQRKNKIDENADGLLYETSSRVTMA